MSRNIYGSDYSVNQVLQGSVNQTIDGVPQGLINFYLRWFLGPAASSNDSVKLIMVREVGICRDMEKGGFVREAYAYEGFVGLLNRIDVRVYNIFMGIGFWPLNLSNTSESLYYDRLVYDIDCDEDPEKALRCAYSFGEALESSYSVTSIIVRSGFKGAHIYVPLAKPVKWSSYQLLWNYLYINYFPKECRRFVDRNMLQWNRLVRIPMSYNIKNGVRRFAKIVHPEISVETFKWDKLKLLNPSNVVIVRAVAGIELPKPKSTTNTNISTVAPVSTSSISSRSYVKDVLAPCMRKLLEDCRRGVELGHEARVALASYLLNIGYSVDEVVEVFRTQPDFKERVTRYHVEHLAGLRGSKKRYLPYSCAKMKEMGLCVSDCGTKNPLSHNRPKKRRKESGESGVAGL